VLAATFIPSSLTLTSTPILINTIQKAAGGQGREDKRGRVRTSTAIRLLPRICLESSG
jgi:hypothetical protein